MRPVGFTIDGKPYGQPRPRAVRRGQGVAFYDPKTAVEFKKKVRAAYLDAAGEHVPLPKDIPVCVRIVAQFKPPAKCRKAERERLAFDDASCTMKPDADNIAKAILDALSELAYEDDSQVAYMDVFKCYGPTAHTEVHVYADPEAASKEE